MYYQQLHMTCLTMLLGLRLTFCSSKVAHQADHYTRTELLQRKASAIHKKKANKQPALDFSFIGLKVLIPGSLMLGSVGTQ